MAGTTRVAWRRSLIHLRDLGRAIWGQDRLTLEGVVVRLSVDLGKLARIARGADKDAALQTNEELATDMGNIIFSMIRWCDDLGLDPAYCVGLAIVRQTKFVTENKRR
jgi:hypothetical protein